MSRVLGSYDLCDFRHLRSPILSVIVR
jgi:hypothetical protein